MDRRTHTGLLRNLVVREGRRTGALQVRIVTGPGDLDTASLAGAVECEGLMWTRTDALAESTVGGETSLIAGAPALQEEIGGLQLAISPLAFFQTNTEMAERLYAIAAELADLKGWERVFDLYCGIGTVGLSVAARAGEVWGLEIVEPAVADAIANAKRNEIANAKFFAGDVRLALRELVDEASRPDVCMIDPPRAGLSQKVVRRIIEAAPRRIVYISCNPTTLAPNAAQLVEAGYALRRVVPGRHVPADAAHRVRRGARAGVGQPRPPAVVERPTASALGRTRASRTVDPARRGTSCRGSRSRPSASCGGSRACSSLRPRPRRST